MVKEPKTLQAAILFFSDYQNCHAYLVDRRWPDGKITCPKCGSENVVYYEKYRRFHCREGHEAPQFTLKTGTIFEESPIGLDKWLLAMWQVVNCKNGVSSYEIHRAIGVTQKTAWFMLQRCRKVLQSGSTMKLGGKGEEVEVDETYIGGRARNMHENVKKRRGIGGGGFTSKVAVQGLLERHGEVRARVVESSGFQVLQDGVKDHVEKGTNVYTDEAKAYRVLPEHGFNHQFVQHAEKYVDGNVHTNGLENFWSLLKRSIGGTYVSVEPFHLFRYVDEQAYRYNNRGSKKHPLDDGDRFDLAVRQIVGKRLTFAAVTGKVGQNAAN